MAKSIGKIEELQKQFAYLKLLVTYNKKNENNMVPKKLTKAVVMDSRLIAKPPVTTAHGPFKENQLPMQCHHCCG